MQEDISASMSSEVIEYFYRKGGMSDFDYKFYQSIFRKRNMSAKQLDICTIIKENQLFWFFFLIRAFKIVMKFIFYSFIKIYSSLNIC